MHFAQAGQTNEEIEHRIGMVEISLSRFGMILERVQGDIMQVNKGTKEIAMNSEYLKFLDFTC